MVFDDVLIIKNGKNQKAVENPNGKYPIYGSGGIMGYADDYICNANTVIVGRKGSINNPIFVEEPFWNVDTAFGLEANQELLLPKYLFYFCKHFDFEQLNKAVTIPSLTKGDLLRIEINLPVINEQKSIVDRLSRIQKTIEMYRQQLQKYDDLIKSRFVEMFGDPLLNDRGWPCKRIGDLFEVISRGKQPTYVEHSTVRVINQACVYWDRINMDNAKYHDNQSSKKMLPISEYSILINSTGTGTLGRCNVFPELRDDYVYVVDSHVTTLQESSEINAWFFKWFFQHNGIQAKIYSECVNGSTNQIELSREKLSNAMMIVPPIELQNQFAEFVIETNKSKLTLCRYNINVNK